MPPVAEVLRDERQRSDRRLGHECTGPVQDRQDVACRGCSVPESRDAMESAHRRRVRLELEMSDDASSARAGVRSAAFARGPRTPHARSVVGGYLRMLQSGVGGALSDGQRKMIGEAEKSCARIVTLIGELSDIGKLDGGTVVLSRERLRSFPARP